MVFFFLFRKSLLLLYFVIKTTAYLAVKFHCINKLQQIHNSNFLLKKQKKKSGGSKDCLWLA